MKMIDDNTVHGVDARKIKKNPAPGPDYLSILASLGYNESELWIITGIY